METYSMVLKGAMLYFIVMTAIEWGVSLYMKKKVHRAFDTVSSISSGITNNIKSFFKLTVIIVSYDWMFNHFAVFDIQSTILVYILAFLCIDFASYWGHRWSHEYNVLWNRHIVHHSSEEYNLPAALRQSISGIFEIFFFLYIPLAVFGIPTEVIAVVAPLHLFAQFWYHTKLINKMGFLEHLIMTPSHHRVHHAINDIYLDRNYSAILICWDKWFGTFQPELEETPPVYGVKKAVKTWNPVLINWMHMWQLIQDAWHAEKLWDKIRIWFMPTGWRPDDVNEKHPIDYTKNAYTQVKYDTASTPFLIAWSFFQLGLHILIQFHIIDLLPDMEYATLLFYGIFVIVSVFAYTTLMDRSKMAVPAEAIKAVFGFGLMAFQQSWFGLNMALSLLFGAYLLLSLGITCYYTYWQKASKPASLNTVTNIKQTQSI